MSHSKQQLSHSWKHTKEDIEAAVRRLDDHIKRLADSTLPKQPYLLSVPSDVPYRHNPHFTQSWHVGTPFGRSEEQLQYLSFLPHQGPYEDLLKVEGGWADDDGSFLNSAPSSRPVSRSAPGTPADPASKKKISLKDYKKEKALPGSEQLTSAAPKARKEPPPAAPKEERKEDLKRKMAPAQSPEPLSKKPIKQERGRSPTRADERRTQPPHLDGTNSPRPKDDPDSVRPLKKRKISGSPARRPEVRQEKDAPKRLPKLLSPTLPSPPSQGSAIPELLLPDLPPSLLKALATPPSSSEGGHQHHRSDSVRSILGSINEEGARSTEKLGPQSGTLGGSRVRSDSQHSARSTTSATGKSTLVAKPLAKSGISTPVNGRSPGPRQRHIIALKYGKKNRKRVESLLRFKPQPAKSVIRAEHTEPVAREAKLSTSKNAAKPTQRDRSPQRPTNKVKSTVAEPVKRPATPLTNGIKDAKSAESPSSKGVQSTPSSKTALKSVAMRRVESVEGTADPATPGDRPIRSSTPLSTERSSRPPKHSPLPASNGHDDDRAAWQRVSSDRDYFSLGRKLKHEGTSLLESASSQGDMHKPMLLMIEALLCFMLNTAIQGHIRPRADPGWSTILGYYNFVVQKSRHFAHLHGLVIQIGAVCRGQIQKAGMERLGRDPLPDETAGAAPTPGSDGNAKSEDAEGYKRRYLLFRDDLIQNTEELNSSWLKGSRWLGLEVLMREYPETWRGRSKDCERRGEEKVRPPTEGSGLARGYFLPMDPASTAFEAAEFALKVMGEWADREDVDWRTRVHL
jgi:hypothetical protein